MLYSIQWTVLPLLFLWAVLLSTAWLLGVLPMRPPARIADAFARWGTFDLDELGGFSYGRLILISAIGLFLELLLIRWISSEIRIFAYFKNLVLVGCFFGFGLGCYLSRRRVQLMNTLLPLLALAIVTEFPWQAQHKVMLSLSEYIGGLADVHVFARYTGGGARLYLGAATAFSVVIPVLALATMAMIPMGQLVARCLETARAGITAYSANVAASIVGIWAFTGLCFVSAPPAVWFLPLGAALIWLLWSLSRFRGKLLVWFVVVVALLFIGAGEVDYQAEKFYATSAALRALKVEEILTYWSPYQKLQLAALGDAKEKVHFILTTNGSWYQEILNLSPAFATAHPEYVIRKVDVPLAYHRYNMPYRFVETPQNVLILGSGMGNDVAAALRNGAQRVVAVEIDPLIQRLGFQNHPEHPYSDPRVQVVIDDARSYVQNTTERFDLIVSSILDSHTTQSSFTNIRTDNYVYTREGLAFMLRSLKPGGVLSLSFSGERPWFAGRLQQLMTELAPGRAHMLWNEYTFFLVGDGVAARLAADPALQAFAQKGADRNIESAAPTSDDWPYFYHRDRGVPVIMIIMSVLVLALCWIVLRGTGLGVANLQWHFFFLGTGFMLMEVQIISKLALLFGTTWLVNSIAITALLALILLSNATVARFARAGRNVAYVGLLITLAICYFIPLEALLFQSWWLRVFASTLLVCSPVYFAGLIFISSFAECRFQAEAFGSNLLGSVVGGLLEALSFWTGIRSLLIIAGLCYALSMAARRGLSPQPSAPAVSAAAD